MIAYVFPGQGSQKKGMGADLFQKYPEYVKKADEILGYSIEELCLDNPDNRLNLTQYTQPALFIVSALTYLETLEHTGKRPDFVAGHSLGEYTALFAAGAFSFETGVRLVKKRGELMGEANGGAMAAIVGMNQVQVQNVIEKYQLDEVDISNLNTLHQTVIASTKEGIERADEAFSKEKARCVRLKVSAAFHSRYMKEAQEKFEEYLKEFTFQELEIPVISNYTALPYENSSITENLVMQLGSAVRWYESIRQLMDRGCDEIQEIGPGSVLTKMIRRIQAEMAEASIEQEVSGETSVYEIVKEWNRKNPVGTGFYSEKLQKTLKTRTEAVVLFKQKAAVYMEGYHGYFDIHELRRVEDTKC